MAFSPVVFPPGRAILLRGVALSSPIAMTMGIVWVACWAARLAGAVGRRRRRHDDVDLETDQFGGEGGQFLELALGESGLDGDVLPFDVPVVAQPLPEGRLAERIGASGQIADAGESRPGLLRLDHDGRKSDADGNSDRESDPLHEHLGWMTSRANRGRARQVSLA